MSRLPTPKEHPQATTVISTASVAGLLVYELKTRFNIDITTEEAVFIVSGFSALYFFALGKVKK